MDYFVQSLVQLQQAARLSGEERLISTGERNETYLAQVGHRAISFFGYKTDGVYLNQADLDASPHLASATPGSLKIVDINDDGVINDKDRYRHR